MTRLRTEAPNLKTAKHIHYAEILGAADQGPAGTTLLLPRQQMGMMVLASVEPPRAAEPPYPPPPPLRPSRIANGPRIDKSLLHIGTERRLRDKAHLKFVATQPCLICGRLPSHAHHLTFAQKRGLSLKVSDEFTVPLCALHHDELHRHGPERAWWEAKCIAPEPIAAELWGKSRTPSALGLEPAASLQPAQPAPATASSIGGSDGAENTLLHI